MSIMRPRTHSQMLSKIFAKHEDPDFWRAQYDFDPEYRERADTLATAMLQRLRVEDEMIKRLEVSLREGDK